MDYKKIQKKLLLEAIRYGFTDAEVLYHATKGFELILMEGALSQFESTQTSTLSFRGSYLGSMGYASTEKIQEESIPYLLAAARENAEISAGEKETLYQGEKSYPPLSLFAPRLENIHVDKQILLAQRMEAAALHGADSIALLDYCMIGVDHRAVSLLNSNGLNASFTKNLATGYVSAIAKNGDETKTGSYFWKGRDWRKFNPEKVGQEAARRAAALLHAKTVPSGKYSVVLGPQAMTALLGVFSGIFYGENVQKGFSLLKNKIGEQLAADCVTLRDDPLLAEGYASVPFDSEGVASRNKAVIEQGILRTLLHNRKSAEKDGTRSTGNGFRPGLSAPVATACTNFYLAGGVHTQEELFQHLGDGLYITSLAGLHAGANAISGDFSLSAEGFRVEGGVRTHAVEQITVGGNFYQLLLDITTVADDLFFSMNGKGSPSVLVTSLSIAGD